MLLSELLQENTIILDIEINEKFALIDFLIRKLGKIYTVKRKKLTRIHRKVMDRERSMSTGIGKGIAVPHAEVDGINDTMAVLGITRNGVNFNSLDKNLVRIIILLIMPGNRFQEHILTLGGIAHLMKNHLLREKILLHRTPEKIFSCILSEEINELLNY